MKRWRALALALLTAVSVARAGYTPSLFTFGTSVNGSTIPNQTYLVDNSNNSWTVGVAPCASGVICENNAPAGTSGAVILLLWYGNLIYQENASGNWWYWNGTTWIATSGDPRTTGTLAIAIASGKFVNPNTSTQIVPIGTAMISTEENQGWAGGTGGRVAGVAAVTTAQYTAAITAAYNACTTAGQPYCLINMVRVPLNSTLWMGYTGLSPFGNGSGNYYFVGTDTNGKAIYSGGTGATLGTGPGHETNGSGTAYQNYIKTEVAAIVGAGLIPLLDLHWGTPTLVSTGQYVLPEGQPAMPGPGDVLFWDSVAAVFGNPTGTNPCPACIFELYNEPFGTNIYTNQSGNESKYLGSQSLTQFQFPTSTTSPNGLNGGYQMLNNYVGGDPAQNILGGGAVCYAVGYQQILNGIRATGATNVIAVGNANFTGEPEFWSQAGGQMVVTDTLTPSQLVASFHAYGYAKGTANFVTLQNAGLGFMVTEMGNLATATGTYASYVGYRNKDWGYTWWSWDNFNASANMYTNGNMAASLLWANSNGNPQPTGSN
jgi:hypothetical protein